jgi:hypothetical protein
MSKLSLSHHTYKQNRLTGVFSRRTRFMVGYIRRRLSTGHANFEKLHVPRPMRRSSAAVCRICEQRGTSWEGAKNSVRCPGRHVLFISRIPSDIVFLLKLCVVALYANTMPNILKQARFFGFRSNDKQSYNEYSEYTVKLCETVCSVGKKPSG